MPDLSIGRSQSMKTDAPTTPYMPMAGEGKKKKGFFSFLKKDKKFTVVSQDNKITVVSQDKKLTVVRYDKKFTVVGQVNQDNKSMVVIDLMRVVEGRGIIVVK